jgi:membrane protease YdiL (CAAX protease family)
MRRGPVIIVIAGLAVFAGAFAWLLFSGTSLRTSADSARQIDVWTAVVPSLAAMLMIRLFPPRAPELSLRAAKGLPVVLAIGILFPFIWYAVRAAGVDSETVGAFWALSKPVFFFLIPGLILRYHYRERLLVTVEGESLLRPKGIWRWAYTSPVLLGFGYLILLSPLAVALPRAVDYPDPVLLAIGATLTFITANIMEELFFRVILQSRLELAYGRWPAIVTSALVFALMHLPSHAQGGFLKTLAVIVVSQGTFGLFTGYLWSRYRNIYALVGAHSIINTVPLLLMS